MGSNRLYRAEKFKLLYFLIFHKEIREGELEDFLSKEEIKEFWAIYEVISRS